MYIHTSLVYLSKNIAIKLVIFVVFTAFYSTMNEKRLAKDCNLRNVKKNSLEPITESISTHCVNCQAQLIQVSSSFCRIECLRQYLKPVVDQVVYVYKGKSKTNASLTNAGSGSTITNKNRFSHMKAIVCSDTEVLENTSIYNVCVIPFNSGKYSTKTLNPLAWKAFNVKWPVYVDKICLPVVHNDADASFLKKIKDADPPKQFTDVYKILGTIPVKKALRLYYILFNIFFNCMKLNVKLPLKNLCVREGVRVIAKIQKNTSSKYNKYNGLKRNYKTRSFISPQPPQRTDRLRVACQCIFLYAAIRYI
jgi:hypothetical protein